ncbi:MAG: Ice-binding protein [Frankiales bacterium]|nr:Ice-binding protein [Frankiales bacterium]
MLAGTGVVNRLATTISGDLGASPSSSVVGFPPGFVAGTVYAGDPTAAQAQIDRAAAYADAAARVPDSEFAGDLNGRTFHPGVYHTAAALALTGTVTLDGDGDPNAVFVFQIDAALKTAAGSNVDLIGGARPSHVFWQVNGAAGTILTADAITLGAGTQLIGRALAGGTVTMADNTIRFTSALPPVITIDGGGAAVTKDTTPTITGTTNALAGTALLVTVAGQALTATVQTDGTWSVTAPALSAGTYDVVASVRDPAGNVGSATESLVVEVNPNPVWLASASTFSVLAGTSVVNTGATTIGGDVGVSPSSSVGGFPPGQIAGTIHAGDDTAAQAQQSVAAAYADAAGRAPSSEFSGDLNGSIFHAGVYHSTAAMALTGTVTLDGENNPNAVFIFQVDAAANTAEGSIVNLVNGAQASHVFWVVAGAVGTGALSSFSGTIMSAGSITLGAGAQLVGRALCDGTVTMAANEVEFGN